MIKAIKRVQVIISGVVVLSLLALAGCGQTGALYLPDKVPTNQVHSIANHG